jgi:hypothetical protein
MTWWRRATFGVLVALGALRYAPGAVAQQVPDSAYRPSVTHPAYAAGTGPVVYVDEAHHNFHTATGNFLAFARLLAADGYTVRRFQGALSRASLDSIHVLVISNAIAAENATKWSRPVRSAFTDAEVAAVQHWTESGGALLLIADHMPMAGSTLKLGAAFGTYFLDGFAMDPSAGWSGVTMFRRSDGSLAPHPITDGRNPEERIDSVASFTGSAFTHDEPVDQLMILPKTTVVLLPQVAWRFSDSTPAIVGSHMLQGAVRVVGRGRIAVFGEAGMFTAQRRGPQRLPMGLNDPRASQNAQFVLNVMHWLTGLLPGDE